MRRQMLLPAAICAVLHAQAPLLKLAGTPPPALPATTVKVLELGAEPRVLPRWSPPAGRTQKLRLGLTIESAVVEGEGKPKGIAKPPLVLSLTCVSEPVTATVPVFRRRLGVREATLDPTSSLPEGKMKAYQTELEGLVGTQAAELVTESGRISGISVRPRTGATSSLAEALRETLFQQGALAVPLPETPIGAGSVWEAETNFLLTGILTPCTVRYTLASAKGRVLQVEGRFEQGLDPILYPSPFTDAKFESNHMRLVGTVSATIDLDQPAPVDSKIAFKIIRKGTVQFPTLTQNIDHISSIEIRLGLAPGFGAVAR